MEECKSVEKGMILSDLAVHKEQYPTATFFERKDEKSLKEVLKNYENFVHDRKIATLKVRTKLFAEKYVSVVKKVLND